MTRLKLLSGGAAQGLVSRVAPAFEARTGFAVEGTFSAVGALVAELRAGAAVDLVILTAALIAELEQEGRVVAGSAVDLGAVATAIASRSGTPLRPIKTAEHLRAAVLDADEIFFPDPERATAGIHFLGILKELDVHDAVRGRLRTFPNGATAMRALADSLAERPMGCTQATEILSTPGVDLVAPLPPGCELATIYTAAICTGTACSGPSALFVDMLGSKDGEGDRRQAGFVGNPRRWDR